MRRALPSAPVAGVLAVLAATALAFAARGYALIHQCVPDAGALSWWGTRLAMVQRSADCPVGTLEIGGEHRSMAVVLATVALPVAVAHLLAVATALGLSGHARGRLASAVTVLRGLVLRVLGSARLALGAARRRRPVRVGVWVAPAPRGVPLGAPRVVRGPPALLPALA